MPVIGLLHIGSPDLWKLPLAAFHKSLSENGYVDGRNVAIEYRWAKGQFDRLPEFAADLIRRHVAVIFASGPPAVRAARAQTATIPIVFFIGEDPIKEALFTSLNRPAGNVTGVTNFQNQLFKQLGLLHDIVPTATSFALLINPSNPNAKPDAKAAQSAAEALRVELRVLTARTEDDVESAFAAMVEQQVGGALVGVDSFGTTAERLVAVATRHAVPTIYNLRDYAAAGGLMSYGASRVDAWRQAGTYVGQILKGRKPRDLPVQQSTKFELVINLNAAKAIGLTIPPGVLAIADEAVE
jgi:putative ABC transport system substrate-binding protein